MQRHSNSQTKLEKVFEEPVHLCASYQADTPFTKFWYTQGALVYTRLKSIGLKFFVCRLLLKNKRIRGRKVV